MTRLLILAIGLASCLQSQTPAFLKGETLIYTAGFSLFSAGKTIMEVAGRDTTDPDMALHITSRTETAPFFDHIYRIRDRVDLWLDQSTLELRRMERDIQEGRFERKDTTTVDRQAGLIFTRKDTLIIEGPVFDPVGAVYYLRTLPLAIGDEIYLSIFNGKQLRKVAIAVSGKEVVKVPMGEFECLVLKPMPLDRRRLTKVDGLMHLWLATNERRTPVRLEQTTSFGTMVLRLLEVR
ncbi:MAG: DUF3108 domain-containing protein [Candidatus Neomarinimicrobiota bacterium]